MEGDKHCLYDSLTFYNGKDATAPLIDKICGNGSASGINIFRSDKNFLTIRFVSDAAITNEGFILNWTITDKKEDRK